MGRITSTVGLITGIPIQDTVDKLIKLQSEPRDRLQSATDRLTQQQQAITDLTARLLAVQLSVRQLKDVRVFNKITATSANSELVAVTASGAVPPGTYQFTPVRRATAQQLLGTGVASSTAPLGGGTISFRNGPAIDEGLDLAVLNGGQGVSRGKIRITDRSGASAEVDLSFARTIDDVLAAINNAGGINVRAETHGDAIRLVDLTGQTSANLRVQEVAGGRTAEGLGLARINVAASSAIGTDLVRLTEALAIDRLNDGRGLRLDEHLPEFQVFLRDGTAVDVDLKPTSQPLVRATATTSAAAGINGQLTVTAGAAGAAFDGVRVVFVDNENVTRGNETVYYNDADLNNKQLIVGIDAGQTTAADVVAAINREPGFDHFFTAALVAGGNGTGVIALTDTATTSGGAPTPSSQQVTLGHVIAQINAAAPGKLQARLAADGDRLELIDTSEDLGHDFRVEGLYGIQAVRDLGLLFAANGNVLRGSRLLGGLKSPLLSSLNGSLGLRELGDLALTNRAGRTTIVNFANAETLDDLLHAINSSHAGITARVNDARTGILLEDTTGGVGNLVVADGDETTQTATKLQLVADVAANAVDSGDLHRASVHENTKLAQLNHGRGIALGRIRITDSSGAISTLNFSQGSYETVGDVLRAINNLGVQVQARINDRGDGIVLEDEAGGTGRLVAVDQSGTTLRDLRLAADAVRVSAHGVAPWVIDGTSTLTVTLDADDSLADLAAKINVLDAGLSASVLNDGSPLNPYRLALSTYSTGRSAAFLVDDSRLGFRVEQTVAAEDALVVFGAGAQGVLAASSTDRFDKLLPGLEVQLRGTATSPVNVTVAVTSETAVTRIKAFVTAYNELQSKLATYTSFDAATFKTGLLFGSGETLRITSDLSRVVSGRFLVNGQIQSLETIGIDLADDGTLSFDEGVFHANFADRREDLQQLFIDDGQGFSAKLDAIVETLVGRDRSLLINRAAALADKIQRNQQRIQFLNERLDRQREKLLTDFARMEVAIAKVQDNLQALSALKVLEPLTSVRR